MKQPWLGALKTAISTTTAVIITNFTDPGYPLYSWLWVRHMLIGIAATFVLMEAKYWKQWADTLVGNGKAGP